MFDLKVIHSVLDQLEQEKGISKASSIETIESALASAYKKEYGKRGQIIRANFDIETGKTDFFQIKIVVDETIAKTEEEIDEEKDVDTKEESEQDERVRFNPEHHIMIEDAQKIKKNAILEEEIVFPLEPKSDFGRIAAQTAKQTIIQKIREAERGSISKEFGGKQGEIVSGIVQRIERGNIFVDLKRATVFYLTLNKFLQKDTKLVKELELIYLWLKKLPEEFSFVYLDLTLNSFINYLKLRFQKFPIK